MAKPPSLQWRNRRSAQSARGGSPSSATPTTTIAFVMDLKSSDAASRLGALFDEVLTQAGQDPDRFLLVQIPGKPRADGRQAAFYHAGPIDEDPDDILHGAELSLANSPGARDRHRVAAFTDIDWDDPLQEAILAGLLRHEIRHGEQFDALGYEFFDLYDLAELVAGWKQGGMPRSGTLYGLIPAELDANTAAAQFLRNNRSTAVAGVLQSEHGQLARSHTDPAPLGDLPTKMIAFLYLFREVADDPGRSPGGITFEDRLRYISPRAAATWAALAAA